MEAVAEQVAAVIPEQEIAVRSQTIQAQIKDLRVADIETANQAGTIIGVIAALRKKVAEVFDPIINSAFQTHKKAIEKKKQFDSPLEIAEKSLKRQIAEWKLAEDRRREAERLQREAEAKKQHEDLVVQVAAEVEKTDGTAAAEIILREADEAPPVVMEKQAVAGVTITPKWKAEILDLRAYAVGLAEKKIPIIGIIGIEEIKDRPGIYCNSFLNKQAGSLMAEMVYPGVRVYEDRQVGRK